MDTCTGVIYPDEESVLEAIKKGKIINPDMVAALPDGAVKEMEGMNEQERVDWWKKNNKKAFIEGWLSSCCSDRVIKWLTGFECTKCHKKDVKVIKD